MSCDRNAKRIALAAGGDLPPRAARRLREHLATCAGCRAKAESHAAALASLALLRDEPLRESELASVRAGVRRRLAAEDAGRARLWRSPRFAAAAATLLALAVWLAWPRPFPRPAIAPADPATAGPEIAETSPEAPAGAGLGAAGSPAPPPAPTRPATPTAPSPPAATDAFAAPRTAATAATVVKLVSDQRDIVIYWLIDKETIDEGIESNTSA